MNKERLIDQFTEMLKIDSESGQERKIADYLKKTFKKFDVELSEDDTADITGHGAGNLLIRFKGDPDVAPVYFTVHMDTVTPGKGVNPRIEEDYIVSDGTTILGSDDKAGIAVLIEMLHNIEENQIPHGDIEIVITVGEESGLVGAKAFDISQLKSKFGYAIDSTGKVGTVVTAAPTQSKVVAHIHGKTAHAGVAPEEGISAINIAAKAVSMMKLGRIDNETTANIGRIEGGSATNIVADYAYVLAETRSLNPGKMDDQARHMRETFENAAASLGGRVEVNIEKMYDHLYAELDSEVVTTVRAAIENIGREADFISLGGGSDGNVFNGKGIQTVVLGLGYENIHTTSERMPIVELVKAAELVLEIVKVQHAK